MLQGQSPGQPLPHCRLRSLHRTTTTIRPSPLSTPPAAAAAARQQAQRCNGQLPCLLLLLHWLRLPAAPAAAPAALAAAAALIVAAARQQTAPPPPCRAPAAPSSPRGWAPQTTAPSPCRRRRQPAAAGSTGPAGRAQCRRYQCQGLHGHLESLELSTTAHRLTPALPSQRPVPRPHRAPDPV